MEKEIMERLTGWLLGLAACAAISLLSGCRSTRYVPVETVRTEYKDRTRTVRDTVRDSVVVRSVEYRHDSTMVRTQGDTVYVDRWHTLRVATERIGRTEHNSVGADTVRSVARDTVKVAAKQKTSLWGQAARKAEGLLAFLGALAIGWLILAIIIRTRGKV